MSIYVPWLADAARLTGYPVVEVAGWQGRGHGGFRVVEGVVLHHTADGPGEYPSLRVVRDGRADLVGPLCNYGLGRSGTIYVVAAGVAWHAGASRWVGFTDLNDEFLGIEAESAGTRDDWTAEQHDAYPRLVAAALYYMRRGADRAAGHKEVCLPAGRKIDPAFWNLAQHRDIVAAMLADPLHRIPRGGALPTGPGPVTTGRSEDLEMNIPVTYYAVDEKNNPTVPDPAGPAFRASVPCEMGATSQVIARSFVKWTAKWGAASFRVVAWSATAPIAEAPSGQDWWELPAAARSFTVEGMRQHAGVQVGASMISIPH